ncbi:DUF4145 domain-containing protein [Nesterenkonia cremea]|uniref:DUF4145 domain-containing protein n=1 Tax=Nesterenkonia cremea TaxID=1882340 RepID=UPI001667F37E|nr:DUF4145 domain-containing protein [Nesterenkonia cremea]
MILEVIESWWVNPEGEWDDFEPYEWLVGKCPGCAGPYVLTRESDPDWRERYYQDEPVAEMPYVQSFPETHRALSRAVPLTVRESYDEAISCFRSGLNTAAVIMARRTVELVCKEQGLSEGTLAQKLRKMREQDLIDERLFDWSSVAKDLGNNGAHDFNPVAREDADDALLFTEALASYLYTFAERYETHRRREVASD